MNLPRSHSETEVLAQIRRDLALVLEISKCRLADSTVEEIAKLLSFLSQREAELLHGGQGVAPHTASSTSMQSFPPGKLMAERRGPHRSSLSHIPLFAGVSSATVDSLLSRCHFRDLARKETLLSAGTTNDQFYVIMSGTVGIHVDGDERAYVTLADGECVGEVSILGDMKVTANVVGREPCRLMVIHCDVVWSLIRSSSEFARNLLYALAHRVQRSTHHQRQSAREARLDPLTGLHNRRSFSELFVFRRDDCKRDGKPLSLVMVDIDHFKRFNDTHGHVAGDVALCAVAETLAKTVREGVAARYGGEEFVALLPGADIGLACALADTLRLRVQALRLRSSSGEDLPPITISVGVVSAMPEDDLESLVHAADQALYEAKGMGRNCVAACRGRAQPGSEQLPG